MPSPTTSSGVDPLIFRTYDIRGKAHKQINEEVCRSVGRVFGSILKERYKKEHPDVVVGRDARTHGPLLEKAIIEGLTQSGCTVHHIGQTPSPVNYFILCTKDFDGSIQVTASHNPAEDNGLKIQIRGAEAFCGDELQLLYKKIIQNEWSEGDGHIEELDAITPYIEHLTKLFDGVGKGMSVAVDTGNGVAGPVYTEILRRVGCTLTGLYIEPDGTFPNHPANPSEYETLKDLVNEVRLRKYDCGFAFDGDGDRLGIVDEKGYIRTADEILLLLAQDHLQRHRGLPVIFSVSNSSVLETEVTKWGGTPIMIKVGHSYLEHALREHGALLGGEQSGHFFCAEEYFGFDDALVAALRILAILQAQQKPLSELCSAFPKVYQKQERRPFCPDEKKTEVIANITSHFQNEGHPVNTLDGARIDFGDGAWAGIRQSNTSPCISVCLEARSAKKLAEIERMVLDHLSSYEDINLTQC